MNMSGGKRTSNKRESQKDGWNFGFLAAVGAITAACATVIAGVSYYLGTQNREPNRQQCSYQDNASVGSSTGHQENLNLHDPCAICQGKVKPLRRLDCGHTFHSDCISQWLAVNKTCPICRNPQE